MTILCVITARGGSKRIPRKNIRNFLGKPIIAYSIEAALECQLIDEVMVSTDDFEIAEVARTFGASVPFMRSDATSDDYATTADVLLEVLDEYDRRSKTFDAICCVYPTAPFVTANKLNEAIQLYLDSGASSVLTTVRFSFPPQRGFVLSNNSLSWWMPEYATSRSQDLEPILHDAGQIYIIDTAALRKTHSLIAGITIPFEVAETEVQDIDTEIDWQIAEMKYKRMVNG